MIRIQTSELLAESVCLRQQPLLFLLVLLYAHFDPPGFSGLSAFNSSLTDEMLLALANLVPGQSRSAKGKWPDRTAHCRGVGCS
jgi:hypothetical protein